MRFEIYRAKTSFDYRKNPAITAWQNNDQNNTKDLFIMFDDAGNEIFHSMCQTVCNTEGIIEGARYFDTLAPGPMAIRTDVEQRSFWGRIHGIANAKTLAGEVIGLDSTTKTNASRWLVHDWQKHRPNPKGEDTRVAWSAGCVVMPDEYLDLLGQILDAYKVQPGTIIPGELMEES